MKKVWKWTIWAGWLALSIGVQTLYAWKGLWLYMLGSFLYGGFVLLLRGDEEQEIEPDTPCGRCMYDGRGLPECNYCDIHNDYIWFRKKEDDSE